MPKIMPVFQSKRGINRPTSFVEKLFNILKDKSNSTVIAWCEEGTSFIVVDKKKFSESILPKFFRHGKFSSFVRQLNMYDFHKVGEPTWLEYSHENFQRDHEEDLHLVGRKTNSGNGSGSAAVAAPGGRKDMDASIRTSLTGVQTKNSAVESELRAEVDKLKGEVDSLKIQLAQALRANSNLMQQQKKQVQIEEADMFGTFSSSAFLSARQGPLETPTLRAHFEMVDEPTTGGSTAGVAHSLSFASFDAYAPFSSSNSSSMGNSGSGILTQPASLTKRDSHGTSDLRCDEVLDANQQLSNSNSSNNSSVNLMNANLNPNLGTVYLQPMYQPPQPQVYYSVPAEPAKKADKVWDRKQVESSPAPEDEEMDIYFYNLYLSDESKVPDLATP